MTNPSGCADEVDLRSLLEELGDPALLWSIVEGFVRDEREQVEGLQQAALAGAFADARFLAHAIKGAARNFGLPSLVGACERAERLAAAGDREALTVQARAVANAFADAVGALRAAGAALDLPAP